MFTHFIPTAFFNLTPALIFCIAWSCDGLAADDLFLDDCGCDGPASGGAGGASGGAGGARGGAGGARGGGGGGAGGGCDVCDWSTRPALFTDDREALKNECIHKGRPVLSPNLIITGHVNKYERQKNITRIFCDIMTVVVTYVK